jgi:hypothetical protein
VIVFGLGTSATAPELVTVGGDGSAKDEAETLGELGQPNVPLTPHVARAVERAHTFQVRWREREVSDQLHPADLREPPKPAQRLLGEHVPSRHPEAPPYAPPITTRARHAPTR